MRHTELQRGFTLVESMIAMGIIVTGLVALVALAWVSVASARSTSERFIAAGIAQEGIEAVRSLRDTNWLLYETDSTTTMFAGLTAETGVDYTAVLTQDLDTADATQGQWLVDFTPNSFGNTCTEVAGGDFDCTAIWKQTVSGRYTQRTDTNFDPAQHEETPYQRLLALRPICRDPEDDGTELIITNDTDVCADTINGGGNPYEQVGLNVVVTVQWSGRGSTTEYILEERMYDWKY